MNIDWESTSTKILLNSRIPKREREIYTERLRGSNGLNGHVWVTTSGTSGHFKFVALSKKAILDSAEAVNAHLHSDDSDVWIHALPGFHIGGIGIWARSYLSGAKVIDYKQVYPQWDAENFLQLAHATHATLTALVPTQVYDIVTQHLLAPSSMRAVVVGGGVLTRALYDQALELQWNLLPSYGLTECASQVATTEQGQFDVAVVLSHVELDIDEEGCIWIKSPSLLTTYGIFEGNDFLFVDPKENGWLKTEDKGEKKDQLLRVFGRASDFVKIGGESVNLLHLQRVLDELKLRMHISRDMVVVAIADDRLGHAIQLIVEGSGNLEIDILIKKYQESVMPYERIRHQRFVKRISRTSLGKAVIRHKS